MANPPSVVYVSWMDWARGQQFLIDQHTQLRVERAALPIVFVPGIMGSRLKKVGGGRAWDPDDLPWTLHNFYNATPTEREALLTQHPLEVNRKEAGGPPTTSFRTRMEMKFSYSAEMTMVAMPPDWDWLNLPPGLDAEAKLNKTIDTMIDHGWDEVAWGFYGSILLDLAKLNLGDLSRCFVHPVYAYGYNWIDDNLLAGEALVKRIDEIIQKENYAHHPCDRVILVSHSMGGLVTRSCVLHSGDAEAKTLGIIHGAQPATGAPAAYRRMRAGFEPPNNYNPLANLSAAVSNRVLGPDSSTVVPVLAKCIGGMELLPTKHYRTNTGSAQWLTMTGKNGQISSSLPASNPYSEIYSLNSVAEGRNPDQQFLTLVPHPTMLAPQAHGGNVFSRYSPGNAPAQAVTDFQTKLKAAEGFHDGIELRVHPTTYVTYTGHAGPRTYDHVKYGYKREQHVMLHGTNNEGFGPPTEYDYEQLPEVEGQGIDLNQHPPGGGAPEYFELAGQEGNGDGTVPVSSSSSLLHANGDVQANNARVGDPQGKRVSADIAGVEHSAFFGNADAVKFTMMAIRQLDLKYRKLKIGI